MTNKDQEGLLVPLSVKEAELLQSFADTYGLTLNDAASKLISDAMARRIKRNTGKTPAKVYSIGKK